MTGIRRIPPAGSFAVEVAEGDRLRITDPVGGQPADLNAFVLPGYDERFSAGRTRTMEGMHPAVGAALWSGPPYDRRLFTIVADSVDANDVLFPRCSRLRYEEVGLDGHPNCQDLLADAIAPYGLAPSDVHDSFNLFMRTTVTDDGRPVIVNADPPPAGTLELLAHVPLLVALSACPNGVKYGREISHLDVEVVRASVAASAAAGPMPTGDDPAGTVPWMSRVMGRPVVPPRRRTLEDLTASRGFLEPEGVEAPPGVEHLGHVAVDKQDDWTLRADVWRPVIREAAPIVLHLHGGGYCGGSGPAEARTAALLASCGFTVVCPSYSLAPERPFPAALHDARTAYRWVRNNASELGGDQARVVVSGGSAGAGLAAAMCLDLVADPRSGAHERPRGLVLLYGLLDLRAALGGDQDPAGLQRLWAQAYLGESFEERLDDPRVSPAASSQLHQLPPTYVSCGGRDRLLPQSLAMLHALSAAGVEATGSVVAGSDHGFAKYAEMTADERAEMRRMVSWIHRCVAATDRAGESSGI